MFTHRKRLRQLAACVLLGWFFALASGIAHACVTSAAPQTGPADRAGHPCHAVADPTAKAPSQSTAACEKFCDDSSNAIQAAKPQLDPSGAAVLAPPPSVSPDLGIAVAEGLPRPDPERWRPAAPLTIVYLRLTL